MKLTFDEEAVAGLAFEWDSKVELRVYLQWSYPWNDPMKPSGKLPSEKSTTGREVD